MMIVRIGGRAASQGIGWRRKGWSVDEDGAAVCGVG